MGVVATRPKNSRENVWDVEVDGRRLLIVEFRPTSDGDGEAGDKWIAEIDDPQSERGVSKSGPTREIAFDKVARYYDERRKAVDQLPEVKGWQNVRAALARAGAFA